MTNSKTFSVPTAIFGSRPSLVALKYYVLLHPDQFNRFLYVITTLNGERSVLAPSNAFNACIRVNSFLRRPKNGTICSPGTCLLEVRYVFLAISLGWIESIESI